MSPLLTSDLEVLRFGPTSIGSIPAPDNQPSSGVISIIELDRSIESQPVLTTELASTFFHEVGFASNSNLENLTLFNTFEQWENTKFIDTGNLVSDNGFSVSKVTLEDLEPYEITADGETSSALRFNLAYPTINYYMQRLDVSDLPVEGGAGYVATGAVVYVNGDTSRFPASGTILLGREQISYTSKLTDRFLDCTRGVNGTPIEEHLTGEYLRNAL